MSEKNQLSKNNSLGRDARVGGSSPSAVCSHRAAAPLVPRGEPGGPCSVIPISGSKEGGKDHFSNRDLKFSSRVLLSS